MKFFVHIEIEADSGLDAMKKVDEALPDTLEFKIVGADPAQLRPTRGFNTEGE